MVLTTYLENLDVPTHAISEMEIPLHCIWISIPDKPVIKKYFPEKSSEFFFHDCMKRVEFDPWFDIGTKVSLYANEDHSLVTDSWTKSISQNQKVS